MAEPLGDHGGPEGQDRGAVDADREVGWPAWVVSVSLGGRIGNLAQGRGGIAPISVVPGRLAIARMQTFREVWRQLLKYPLRVVCFLTAFGPGCAEIGHSAPGRG